MNRQQYNYLMRNPTAMMLYQMTGRVPRMEESPDTPLRALIRSIPPLERSRYKGIRLSPKLGFGCGLLFNDASQLYSWLGGDLTMIHPNMPYMSYRLAGFRKNLTLVDLEAHCASYPGKQDK